MIPKLTRAGVLPRGCHVATLRELRKRFGSQNRTRKRLMSRISAVAARARKAGARRLYMNGSFVTSKSEPGDWDGVLVVPIEFDAAGGDGRFFLNRSRLKREFASDLFVVREDDPEILGYYLSELFATDREGRPKGIVLLRL